MLNEDKLNEVYKDMVVESWHGLDEHDSDVFKNPTKKELMKEIQSLFGNGLVRGVITQNGDLYVMSAYGGTHTDIFYYLMDKGIIADNEENNNISSYDWTNDGIILLFVQNKKDDIGTFYLAESYLSTWKEQISEKQLKYLKEIAKKCEVKNNIKIVFKRIWDR